MVGLATPLRVDSVTSTILEGSAAFQAQYVNKQSKEKVRELFVHELGHNLGFPHGNACNSGVTLSYLTTCTDVEYGNNADVMGSSTLSSFFSPTFLVDAGFLPAANMNVAENMRRAVMFARSPSNVCEHYGKENVARDVIENKKIVEEICRKKSGKKCAFRKSECTAAR